MKYYDNVSCLYTPQLDMRAALKPLILESGGPGQILDSRQQWIAQRDLLVSWIGLFPVTKLLYLG